MPAGVGVSGLESDGGDRFFCGGGSSGKVRAVRRPRRGGAAGSGCQDRRAASRSVFRLIGIRGSQGRTRERHDLRGLYDGLAKYETHVAACDANLGLRFANPPVGLIPALDGRPSGLSRSHAANGRRKSS